MPVRKKNQGVSPVIGVVIMVAITVVLGAIIAQFVFDLTGRFTTTAAATLDFQQNLNLDQATGNYNYTVVARVTTMSNADYLAVTAPTADSPRFIVDRVGSGVGDPITPSDVEDAPDNPVDSPAIENNGDGRILVNTGDRIVVEGLDAGDVVQIHGGIDGSENLVVEYTVQDVVPEAYK